MPHVDSVSCSSSFPSTKELAILAAQVIRVEIGLDPLVRGREEPTGGNGRLQLRRGFRLKRVTAGIGGDIVQKLEMIDEADRLNREGRRHVLVMNRDQVVAVRLFPTLGQVRRAKVHDGILAVEA